jgi:hypothetical protein
MRPQLVLFALLSASVTSAVACAKRAPTDSTQQPQLNDFPSFNGAKVELHADGGFAALSIDQVVRHDDHYFLATQRKLCAQTCAALDSVSGSLTAAATDSLFNIVLAQSPFSLKDDYGTTVGGADMMLYTVRITADGRTKTVRADDGTMPEPLRRIAAAVRETISAARR